MMDTEDGRAGDESGGHGGDGGGAAPFHSVTNDGGRSEPFHS